MARFFARLKRSPAPDLSTTRGRHLSLVLVLAVGMLGFVGSLGVGLVTAVPADAATTLFVSGSMGSDNNPCSAIGPCKTISRALSLAGSGATIEVAGTVDDAVSVSTTVTIEQWPGRAPAVVDATGLRKSVFAVSSGASVTLEGLTVTGGAAEGGGLSNNGGSVTVTDTTISGNTTGGAELGGGIANSGTLTVSDTSIAGNRASGIFPQGGGLYNDGGAVTVTDTTITGNTLGEGVPAQGAGVYSTGGILTVTDTTITGNTGTGQLQGSGVFLDTGASATITDATITDNTTTVTTTGGAGVFDRGTLTLGATIVAGNSNNGTTDNCRIPPSPPPVFGSPLPPPESVGYNLTDDTTGTACGFLRSTDTVNVAPDLGPLAPNGGPTETMLPASGSPAVGVIPQSTTLNGVVVCGPGAFDERGAPRPSPGPKCSIGATEPALGSAPSITSANSATFSVGTNDTFTVTTGGFPPPALSISTGTGQTGPPQGITFSDNGNGTATLSGIATGQGTFTFTISAANGLAPAATQSFTLTVGQVRFVSATGRNTNACTATAPCATISHVLSLPQGVGTIEVAGTIKDVVTVSKTVTIEQWPGQAAAVVDATGRSSSVFAAAAGADLTLDALTLTGGSAPPPSGPGITPSGGGIVNDGTVSIADSTITGNEAASGSGATGSGIVNDGRATITDSSITDNTVSAIVGTAQGGGIWNSGTLTITDTTISDNSVSGRTPEGGGIFNQGTVVLTDATVAGNTSSGTNTSGGVFSDGGMITSGATIVAANTGHGATNNCSGSSFASIGYNLTDDTTGTACGFTQPTDEVNVASDLGPLAANGGPTETMLPASGSPAVGVIPSPTTSNGVAVCGPGAVDQRGVPRPDPGPNCTIGAVEAAPGTDPTITSANNATFTKGTHGTFAVTTSPGLPAPVALSVSTGSGQSGLPQGVGFTDNGDGTGTLAGTASTEGTFTFTITASNGVSRAAAQVFTLTVQGPPGPPSALTATVVATSVTLAWSPPTVAGVPPFTSYLVFRGTSSGAESFYAAAGGPMFLDRSVPPGQTFFYTVEAVNTVGASAPSNEVSATPGAAPTITSADNTTFTAGTHGTFAVTTSPADPPSVALSASTGPGQSGLPQGVGFTDNGDGTGTLAGTATAQGTFTFTITASNGVSPAATQDFTLTVQGPPGPPSALTATAASTSVTLTWSPPAVVGVPAFTSYVVLRGTSSGTETTYATTSTPNFTDAAVMPGQTYFYTVEAVNTVGASAPSNEASATPGSAPTITSADNTTFTQGTHGTFTITTSPGLPTPVTLSTSTGSSQSGLPQGVGFTDNGDGTGTLAGTASTEGTFTFTITASNGVFPAATQDFTLTVQAPDLSGGARLAADPMGRGYWIVHPDGGVFTYGDAPFFGSLPGLGVHVDDIVGIAVTPDGGGYWLVGSDGGVFTFGDAPFFGSMAGTPLNKPVVGIADTPDGGGYWLVAADGGVFTFGDAQFSGSMGGTPLNGPVVAMTADPVGGYWLVAADGGLFSFGGAPFFGSMGGKFLAQPVVGATSSPSGAGYWLVASDGGVFSFGSVRFAGSLGGASLAAGVIGLFTTNDGNDYTLVEADGTAKSF